MKTLLKWDGLLPNKEPKRISNEKQKVYLQKKFDEGKISGNKHKAEKVVQDMRTAKDKAGKRMFAIEEFLTSKQVASYFSHLAAKRRNVSTSDNEAIDAKEAHLHTHQSHTAI